MTETWTLNRRKLLSVFLLVSMVGIGAGQVTGGSGYYSDSGSLSEDTGFSIPQYDSQAEIFTNLVAPFLLVAILLQLGLERALMFTLDEERTRWMGPNRQYRDERRKIKRQSLMLSLVISGMLVPTPFFEILSKWTAIVFGGSVMILLTAAFIGFLLVLWSGFSGGGRGG